MPSVMPLTVVLSAGQSRNPEKRELEQAIINGAAEFDGVNVVRIPHLYDLAPKGDSFAALKSLTGDLVVLTWLFDRAAHWVLDRNGVRGQVGEVELTQDFGDDEDDAEADEPATDARVIDSQPRPARHIYCLDLRASEKSTEFLAEIDRIRVSRGSDSHTATSTPLTVEMLQRYENPTNDTYVGAPPHAGAIDLASSSDSVSVDSPSTSQSSTLFGESSVVSIEEHPGRRWYPVIDFSRCTNCMECIDFCLFGVYGVDSVETIVVEQADNCRKGCPACSRVCPANAIIFPQHKTPAIAGAPVDTGGMKIDLSKLFGAPESDEDALDVAARERDEQLILAGRQAVGGVSIVKERLAEKQAAPADALDGLLDELDALDL